MADLLSDAPVWDEDDAVEEFVAALGRVRARRCSVTSSRPRTDFAAIAAKLAARPIGVKASKPLPTEHAPSRESCPHCGVPGAKGCDHWLPCLEQPRFLREPEPDTEDGRVGAGKFHIGPQRREMKFTGKRQGIGASRL